MTETSVVEATGLKDGWAALNAEWLDRTRLAAQWLQAEGVILDVGCGLMSLEAHLPPSSTYIPMDIVRRDSRTILVDINKDRIPDISCDAVVLLGVLEYVDDPSVVIRQLSGFPMAVISYNHVSLNDFLWVARVRSKRVTWRNRQTKAAFRSLLRAGGLQIVRERRVRLGERLYQLAPA